jgi:hypothetical protein
LARPSLQLSSMSPVNVLLRTGGRLIVAGYALSVCWFP